MTQTVLQLIKLLHDKGLPVTTAARLQGSIQENRSC